MGTRLRGGPCDGFEPQLTRPGRYGILERYRAAPVSAGWDPRGWQIVEYRIERFAKLAYHDHLMGILPAVTGTESAGGVQVIARAAQVLRALESEPQGLSLAQLAERVGLPRSTVHRIVTALAAEGLVASVSPTGRVRIGPEFARLAAGAGEFWRPVEPFMRRLH